MTQANTPQEELLPPVAFGSTVTILFSDIRGFTEYTDAYGDEDAYRMLQHHNTLVEEQISLYGGHVVKSLGDSYMVSFDSARTAITCAVAMQRAIDQYNRTQQGAKIEIGIGINTGEPVREAGDFFGGTVNLASRICAAAGPGRILTSETVRHVVGRMQGSEWIDRGFFDVKGFQEPQHLFEVDWAGAGAVRATPVAPPPMVAPPAAAPPKAAPVAPPVPAVPRLISLVPILAGGLVVLLLLGAGGFFLLKSGVGGQEATPTAGLPSPPKGEVPAAAPGLKLLFQDDFSNPARGLFDEGGGVTPGGLVFKRGYEKGEYLQKVLKGPQYDGAYAGNVRIDSDLHYAVEVQARAERLIDKIRYGLLLTFGAITPEHYGLQVIPSNEAWHVFYQDPSLKITNVFGTGQGTALANKGPASNLMRLEVRGSELKVFLNGQYLGGVNDERMKKRPVTLQLGTWLNEDLKEGEGDARAAFSQFKVYALEEASAVSAAEPTPFPTPLPTPVPPKPTPTAATKILAPGDLLYEDDFRDPSKGLFPVGSGTTPAKLGFKRGYENEEFLITAWGSGPNALYTGDVRISSDYQYAVEVQARAMGLRDIVRYGLVLYAPSGGGGRYIFNLTPIKGAWDMYYSEEGRPDANLAGNNVVTPFANVGVPKGAAANLLRLEVRGSELKAFLNGQLLGTVNHEGLKRRPVSLQLGFWITETILLQESRGDARAAFSQFKVYYLGGP